MAGEKEMKKEEKKKNARNDRYPHPGTRRPGTGPGHPLLGEPIRANLA